MYWACVEGLKSFGKEHSDFLKAYETIEVTAYKKYKEYWLKERPYSKEFMNQIVSEYLEECKERDDENYSFEEYIDEHGYHGECYVCFEEFLMYEYQDDDFMKELLTPEEFLTSRKEICIQNAKEAAKEYETDFVIVQLGDTFFYDSSAELEDDETIIGYVRTKKTTGYTQIFFEPAES